MGQYYVGHAVFGLYRFKVGDLTFRSGRGVGVSPYNARYTHVILWVHIMLCVMPPPSAARGPQTAATALGAASQRGRYDDVRAVITIVNNT
jgi:hypothetical protein